jgi:hypothetical protein
MKTRLFFTFLAAAALAGCIQSGGSLVTSSGTMRIEDTTAHYYKSEEGVFLLVWHQLRTPRENSGEYSSTSMSSSRKQTEIQGEYSAQGMGNVRWTCHTEDGKTGTVTIQDREFSLEQGNLFLLAESAGEIQVLQLTREFSPALDVGPSLEGLLQSDLEIREFFSGID